MYVLLMRKQRRMGRRVERGADLHRLGDERLRFISGHAMGDKRAGGGQKSGVGGVFPEGRQAAHPDGEGVDRRARLALPVARAAEVVWMRVGEDDSADLLRRNASGSQSRTKCGFRAPGTQGAIHQAPLPRGAATQKIEAGG